MMASILFIISVVKIFGAEEAAQMMLRHNIINSSLCKKYWRELQGVINNGQNFISSNSVVKISHKWYNRNCTMHDLSYNTINFCLNTIALPRISRGP